MARTNRRRLTETVMLARKKRLQWAGAWLVSTLLLALVVLVTGWSIGQRFEQVQWRVEAPALLKKHIEASMQSMQGKGLWGARPAAVRDYLRQQVRDIDQLEVSRTLPGSLRIVATARQFAALWESPEGLVMLVDAEGRPFRSLERGEQVDLPFLRVDRAHLKAAVALISSMRKRHAPWLAALSEVFADLDGWCLNLSAGQQWLIPFGKESLQYVKNITELLQQEGWNRGIWRIDARQARRWFIRPAASQGVT